MLKKYIDDEQTNGNSAYGGKNRTGSSSSSSSVGGGAGGKLQGSISQSQSSSSNSFNIKNIDEDEERDLRRYEIQCELNSQGASDLVVDLFMNDITNKVFKETVLLAIALLEGGNTQVQVALLTKAFICRFFNFFKFAY